ncbi:TPA: hypothetical protein ACPDKO_000129 [Pasteurella multocida]
MENINLNENESKAQSAQILKALKNGEKLTHLDAERRFNRPVRVDELLEHCIDKLLERWDRYQTEKQEDKEVGHEQTVN